MTPTPQSCPNCGNQSSHILENIQVQDLEWLYSKFGVNIKHLTKNIRTTQLLQCTECKLRYFNPMIVGDDLFYQQLQEEDWYFLHEGKTEYDFAQKHISPSSSVLDIGSGRGALRKHIDCKFYQGLDFSTKAVELAKKDGVNVISESVEIHSEKHKDFYDVVVAFQVLEHIPTVKTFIQASLDCLKPGGKLIIAVPNNDAFVGKISNNTLNLPPHHNLHWNEQSLKELGKKFKLIIVDTFFEKVTDIHHPYYLKFLFSTNFSKLLLKKTKLVDTSFVYRVINKLSSKFSALFHSIKTDENGHTIIIVYQKY